MNKLEIVLQDQKHKATDTPKWNGFDNNYLYYLYCKWYVEWDYDDARLYLHKHIWQFVAIAMPPSIVVPYELHDDVEIEMYMIVDELYRWIFEDTKELNIVDKEGNKSKWIRFEKYYHTHQVYWYIKFVVGKRILWYFQKIKKFNENNIVWYDENVIRSSDNLLDEKSWKIWWEILVNIVLSSIIWISEVDKFIFICIYIQWLKIKEVSRLLSEMWHNYSDYKINKISKTLINRIKERIKDYWLGKEDFI